MSVERRHNVHVFGEGEIDLVFGHGFGCDQNMWRLVSEPLASEHRILLYDLVGSGRSDLTAYDRGKYATLEGHALDLLEILDAFAKRPVVFVGHSVSAMIGLVAGLRAPERFVAQIMVAPSPCYVNDGDYVGGFSRADIDGLLDTMDSNYLGWASAMAPQIMGTPERPELGQELTNSFCRTDPEIAKHFARVTFLGDHRRALPKLNVPTLLLQCSDDFIAPRSVGAYLHRHLRHSTLQIVHNTGHCPHLSASEVIVRAIREYLVRGG